MSTDIYNFVVVGGGTAGLVVATRLTEDPQCRVLVLEAGCDRSDDPRVKVPAFYQSLLGTDADWGFRTEAQSFLNNRMIPINQGKALGGSSVINAQVFAPPTKKVLDAWVALGNAGWDWDDLRAYYYKSFTSPSVPAELEEKLGIDNWAIKSDKTNGPLQLSFPGDQSHPLRQAWAKTFNARNRLMANDPWASASVGGFSNVATVHPIEKERSHAANSYYKLAKDRPNFHVLTDASVEKITFQENGSVRASGVQYRHENETKIVHAHKEVILAAGTLQSPRILELSGIGDLQLLEKHNIQVIKDLPGVGENLQDHLVCDISYQAVDELETLDGLARQEPEAIQKAMTDYADSQSGLLTSCGIQTYAYLPLNEIIPGDILARLKEQIRQQHISMGNTGIASQQEPPSSKLKTSEWRDACYSDIAQDFLFDAKAPSVAYLSAIAQNPASLDPATGSPVGALPGKYFTIGAILAHPLSRGSVHVTSLDPTASPSIDPRYLSHPMDMEIFAHAVAYLETIAKSAPLSNWLKQPLSTAAPLANPHDLESAKAIITAKAVSMWHPASTCVMLPEDKGGVVDTSLRVYGISNLRVVDASVVPVLPAGNLQSTVYAVAEKAAELIKAEYRN